MSEKIIVPALGESITEATISKWLKNTGDSVEADEPIVELETDKVNLEVPSPINGILGEINAKNGQTVEVGSTLGTVNDNGSQNKNLTNDQIEKKAVDNNIEPEKVIEISKIKNEEKSEIPKIFDDNEDEDELLLTDDVKNLSEVNKIKTLSPAVRKIVNDQNLDIEKIKGSGKDGRILKGDLIEKMSSKPEPSDRKIKFGQEERIKMTRLRQTIAKRLKQAQENAAMLTTFNEVDMTEVMKMREESY